MNHDDCIECQNDKHAKENQMSGELQQAIDQHNRDSGNMRDIERTAEREHRLHLDALIVRIGKSKTTGEIIIALSQFADDAAVYRAVSKKIQEVP